MSPRRHIADAFCGILMDVGALVGYEVEGESTLRKISGRCFSNREIRLDGYEYVDCSFHSCRFVYSGRKDFSLTGNMVSSDCILVFRDRAADTINALSDLYGLGDWGRKRVIATLEQITELSEAVEIAVH